MKKLPYEILVLIFENLHLSFKLECMLVCREWANVLRSTYLYHSIVISKIGIFNRFVRMLENQAHIREQVKELVLLGVFNFSMHEIQFDRLFINLRSIHFGRGINITTLGYVRNRSVLLNQWSNQIQTVKLHNSSGFMYTLLTSSVCPSLISLSIDEMYFRVGPIKLLAAAPNLENLTIFNLHVHTRLLEQVHAAVPNLQSLKLMEATLRVRNYTGQINSADSMKAVHISFINKDPGTILHWLQYISVKYINISILSFVCSGDPLGWLSNTLIQEESRLLLVLQTLCHLKSFKTSFPASIKTLFNAIEKSNSKIEELSFIARYSNKRRPGTVASDYYRLITELVLRINSTRWLYVLQHMKFIKKLEVRALCCSHINLDLSEVIKQCPAPMESLMVKEFDVVSKDQIHQHHQLNKLGITRSNISQEVYSYISNSFPNLRHLELGCLNFKNEIIMLETLMLYSLRITINNTSVFIAVTARDNNITKYYRTSYDVGVFENYDSSNNYNVIKPSSTPIQETESSTQFFFGSIKTLFINNQLAY
jgi:hypothetical protein